MAETAVGLFEDANVAESVADALGAHGIASQGIRILARPTSFPMEGLTSTPAVDFAVALARDLRSMGATDQECAVYVEGVKRGNVIVFGTGTREQAEAAITLMNQYAAIEVEEYAGAVPSLPAVHYGEGGGKVLRERIESANSKSDGARLFTW
jgi:hypothetical protein